MADYSQHTIGSKNPVKRWLHRQRFAASLRLLDLRSGYRFLDYGCGDGELSLQVYRHHSDVEIVAYDPATELFVQAQRKLSQCAGVTVTSDFNSIVGVFDRVACLETIEHLPAKELDDLFWNIKKVLKNNGHCLFTFPVEHGFAALAKNSYRLMTKRDKYASFGKMIRSVLGLHVDREQQEQLSDCITSTLMLGSIVAR